jgi:hypothetical protein
MSQIKIKIAQISKQPTAFVNLKFKLDNSI